MKIVAEVEQNFSSSLFPEISENVAMDFSPDAPLCAMPSLMPHFMPLHHRDKFATVYPLVPLE